MFESIQDIILEQFLVRDPHFDWLSSRTVFPIPGSQSDKKIILASENSGRLVTRYQLEL